MRELSVTEQLMYSTTRVECIDGNGAVSYATAFFCKLYVDNDRYFEALVTNRHVLEKANELTFHITVADAEGDPTSEHLDYHIQLQNKPGILIYHPNPNVDLAILLIRGLLIEIFNKTQKRLFFKTVSSAQIANLSDNKFDALEEVLMVGYPVGLWDSVNNRPLFRRGITATDPKVDYMGQPIFLIDCACIQGSSGSPVFYVRKGLFTDKFGKPLNRLGEEIELMGIQCAMPDIKQVAVLDVLEVPTVKKAVGELQVSINIGHIIKAEKLIDFIPILQERLKILEGMLQQGRKLNNANV